MMRLFDKVISQTGGFGRATAGLLAERLSAVVCLDSIAEYYATTPREVWNSDMYPYATPPWEMFFAEWNEPQEWVRPNGVIDRGKSNQQAGLLGVVWKDNEDIKRNLANIAGSIDSSLTAGVTTVVSAQPVVYYEGKVRIPDCKSFWLIRQDGWVTCHFLQGPCLDSEPDGGVWLGRIIGSFDHIAMLAFTFANCKNVKLEDVTDELQPEEKIRRRLKIPEVKRYTLNIAGHVVRPSRDYSQGPQGVMPFHLCRGHFATYTEERKLFGKYVGRFWHPPHMKGKKENGEIVKDYAINL